MGQILPVLPSFIHSWLADEEEGEGRRVFAFDIYPEGLLNMTPAPRAYLDSFSQRRELVVPPSPRSPRSPRQKLTSRHDHNSSMIQPMVSVLCAKLQID